MSLAQRHQAMHQALARGLYRLHNDPCLLALAQQDPGTTEATLAQDGRTRQRRLLLDGLKRALARHGEEDPLCPPLSGCGHGDDLYLNLAKSALGRYPPSLMGCLSRFWHRLCEWLHVGRYEDHDPRWMQAFYEMLTCDIVSFPTHLALGVDPTLKVSRSCTIAIAGDWGTGNQSSRAIATAMVARRPDITIHLGDVYYAGTREEEEANLIALWPPGPGGSFTLNSNHEMYAGGYGLFDVALRHPAFRRQQGLTYFSLIHPAVRIIAIDSAYAGSKHQLYQIGSILPGVQADWIRAQVREARSQGQIVILCSHHHGIELTGSKVQPFHDEIIDLTEGGPDFWLWGHVHGAGVHAVAQVGSRTMRCRCIGHGGIPYLPIAMNPALEWLESGIVTSPDEPARGLNGFYLLELASGSLRESFIDEHGQVDWSQDHTLVSPGTWTSATTVKPPASVVDREIQGA